MNDPLAELKDIHLPPPVSSWPLAPGWWALFIIIIIVFATVVYAYMFYKRRHGWRKAALAELAAISNSRDINIEQLANLVRRSAISAETAYRSKAIAAQLHGKHWQSYLQKHMNTDAAYCLAIARYEGKQTISNDILVSEIKNWIKRHCP
jgi:hypothetical protein